MSAALARIGKQVGLESVGRVRYSGGHPVKGVCGGDSVAPGLVYQNSALFQHGVK